MVALPHSPDTTVRQRLSANQRANARYSWWMGRRSKLWRGLIDQSGWRLSRWLYRHAGCPVGAKNWPFGLSLLPLNADETPQSLPWLTPLRRSLLPLMQPDGTPLFADIHVDQGMLAYSALRAYEQTSDARYFAFARCIAAALAALPGVNEGCLPYQPRARNVLIDGLAFACPLFARMARLGGGDHYSALALRQLQVFEQNAGVTENGSAWPWHGFNATSGEHLGLSGWGRGIAWLLLALTDTQAELPAGASQAWVEERRTRLLDGLISSQTSLGHWPWRLDAPGAHPDSSVTALVVYALVRAQTWSELPPNYADMLRRAQAALKSATLPNGEVDGASGEAAGFGKYSESFGPYLWSLAPAAAADLICVSRECAHD